MPEGSPAAWGPGVGIADRENFPKSRARDGVFPDVRSSLLTPSAQGSFAEPPPQHRAPFPCALFGALRLCLLAWGVWDTVLGAPQLPPSPHSFLGIILPPFPLLHAGL